MDVPKSGYGLKMIIIGITGKKGVGKNFIADRATSILRESTIKRRIGTKDVNLLPEVEQMALADPIKEFVINTLGIERELIYGNDDAKNTFTKYSWDKMPKWIAEQFTDPVFGLPSGPMTIRHLMQVYGTQLNRDIWGKNIWVEAIKRRIEKCHADCVLIVDVRYQNEIDSIQSWGGKIWKIDGPQRGKSSNKDLHETEKVMDFTVNHDYIIKNTVADTIDSLRDKVRQALKDTVGFTNGSSSL